MKNLSPSLSKLEDIFSKSERVKLPKTCCYNITQNQVIPYNLFIDALNKYGLCILTLKYRDNSATFIQIVKNLGIPHSHKEKDSFVWDIKIPVKIKILRLLLDHIKNMSFIFTPIVPMNKRSPITSL